MTGWLGVGTRRSIADRRAVRVGAVVTAVALGVLSTTGPALADESDSQPVSSVGDSQVVSSEAASQVVKSAEQDAPEEEVADVVTATSSTDQEAKETGSSDASGGDEDPVAAPVPPKAAATKVVDSAPAPAAEPTVEVDDAPASSPDDADAPETPTADPDVVDPPDDTTGDADPGSSAAPVDDATDPAPVMTLVAVSSTLRDSDKNGRTDQGEPVKIVWRVTNESTTRASAVTLTSGTGTTTCRFTILEAGKSGTCSTTRTLARFDVDSGAVSVSARAEGLVGDKDVSSRSVKASKEIQRVPALGISQSWRLTKDRDGDGRVSVGDAVSFRYAIRNAGNVTLKQPVVKGTMLSLRGVETTCRGSVLYPAAERADQSVSCWSSDVTVKAPQLKMGSLTNAVTVSAKATTGGASAVKKSSLTISPLFARSASPQSTSGAPAAGPTKVPAKTATKATVRRVRVPKAPVPKPGLSLVTRYARVVDNYAMNGVSDVGDDVYLEFLVTNSGEVPLSSVILSDRLLGKSALWVVCPGTSLEPGASMTCRGSSPYTVRRSDFYMGSLDTVSVAKAVSDRTGRPIGARARLSTPLGVPTAQTLGASSLAFTGSSVSSTLLLGFGTVALGGLLLLLRRRLGRSKGLIPNEGVGGV